MLNDSASLAPAPLNTYGRNLPEGIAAMFKDNAEMLVDTGSCQPGCAQPARVPDSAIEGS